MADWPLISIHAALLPDGRVMTYGTDKSRLGQSRFMYDIFDPSQDIASSAAHLTLENTTGTYLFCSAQVVLPLTGDLLLTGGDILVNGRVLNRGNADVNIFNPANNQLRPASTMNRPRWYGTTTVLPTGDIYVQGGTDGEDHPEIRGDDGTFRLLTGIDTLATRPDGSRYFDNNYPRNFVAPNGRIFGFDHHWMYEIEPYGASSSGGLGRMRIFGSEYDTPTPDGRYDGRGWSATSSAVMYRPGRILQLGGTQRNATRIDINGPVPLLKDLAPLDQVRQWATATMLPDGKVFVSGGSTRNLLNDPAARDVGVTAFDTLVFDPDTESWTVAAPLALGRYYHSLTLLLPDGTVLSSGGGSPGPQDNLNAQIYRPGYLFNRDGSLAVRPVLDQVPGALPMVVNPAKTFNLSSPDTARIARVTMVKTGSVTHSFDMEQRFIEPEFTIDGAQIRVTLPANPYETPPGYYLVFLIDGNGTPSKARTIRINPINRS